MMCGPALIPALIIGSTAVSTAGQLQAGAYASKMARYQAAIAEQNKQMVRDRAKDAIVQGQDQQRQLGREISQAVGTQEARMAGNNTDITFGSAARTLSDTKMMGAEDQAALSENIRRQVEGFQINAWNFESEKRAKRAEAKQAKTAAMFSAASTILGGATQYANFRSQQRG